MTQRLCDRCNRVISEGEHYRVFSFSSRYQPKPTMPEHEKPYWFSDIETCVTYGGAVEEEIHKFVRGIKDARN